MFVFAELIRSIALLISLACNIIYFILVVRIILSWVDADPYNEIVQIIFKVTEPILAPLRRLPLQLGGIDFSPVIAFLGIRFIQSFVITVLYQIAARVG